MGIRRDYVPRRREEVVVQSTLNGSDLFRMKGTLSQLSGKGEFLRVPKVKCLIGTV